MSIDDSLRNAPLIDRGGYTYIIHPLTDGVPRADPALLRAWCEWAEEQDVLDGATLLLAPEAMGIPLATALSLQADIPMLVVRKRAYGFPDEQVVYCETGYSESCLYLTQVTAADRVVVIEDMVSTGGTLDALLNALKETGCTVQGVLIFADKNNGAATLRERHDVPVRAMRHISVRGGQVEIDSDSQSL